VQPLRIQETKGLLYTFVDITERVRAELEIHRLNVEQKTIEQKERHRIAQILHDDLQQRLFAIKLHLINLEDTLQHENRKTTNMDLAKPVEWLAEAISMTRQLGADLSPLSLREGNVADGILSLSSQMKDQYGLEVELMDKDFEHQFDVALHITLLQAVRELLFNVVKHSGTLKAKVTIELINSDWVYIIVSDEGKGFDAKAILSERNRGRGLRSLQQDLKLFRGYLDIESEENGGTRMIIRIPIRIHNPGHD
jgi:signal transduction histidine kinase